LDEPTASLDEVSSELMMKMLQELKKDKLIIVISHSEQIFKQCDATLIFDNKNIDLKSND
jgi:ABC-type transport system involved in cytochrome bd biosynthesis fused ATPase/permease subunit